MKEKARHNCVICKKPLLPLDVHHIVPESEEGENTEDNAVPLCTNHHRELGGKQDFYDYLREQRERWYDYCERYLPDKDLFDKKIENVKFELNSLREGYEVSQKETRDVREVIVKHIDFMIDELKDIKQDLTKKEPTKLDLATASSSVASISVTSSELSNFGTRTAGADVFGYPPKREMNCPQCGFELEYEEISEFDWHSELAGFPSCPKCGWRA